MSTHFEENSQYAGIDRRVKKHEIAILNETGNIIARLTIPHQASGFEKLNKTREQVAIRPQGHGYRPVILDINARHFCGMPPGRFELNWWKRGC